MPNGGLSLGIKGAEEAGLSRARNSPEVALAIAFAQAITTDDLQGPLKPPIRATGEPPLREVNSALLSFDTPDRAAIDGETTTTLAAVRGRLLLEREVSPGP